MTISVPFIDDPLLAIFILILAVFFVIWLAKLVWSFVVGG